MSVLCVDSLAVVGAELLLTETLGPAAVARSSGERAPPKVLPASEGGREGMDGYLATESCALVNVVAVESRAEDSFDGKRADDALE